MFIIIIIFDIFYQILIFYISLIAYVQIHLIYNILDLKIFVKNKFIHEDKNDINNNKTMDIIYEKMVEHISQQMQCYRFPYNYAFDILLIDFIIKGHYQRFPKK